MRKEPRLSFIKRFSTEIEDSDFSNFTEFAGGIFYESLLSLFYLITAG